MEKLLIEPIENIPSNIDTSKIYFGTCYIDWATFFMRGLQKWAVYTGPCFYCKQMILYDKNNKKIENLFNYWVLEYEDYVKDNKIIFKIENKEEYYIFDIVRMKEP